MNAPHQGDGEQNVGGDVDEVLALPDDAAAAQEPPCQVSVRPVDPCAWIAII